MADAESLQTFESSLAAFGALVNTVADDQWSAATPCTDWDVRALVNHVLVEQLWAEPMLTGRTIDDIGASLDGDQLGADPSATWMRAARESLAQFTRDGALDATINSSMGPSPARQYLSEMTFDLIMHRWDLGQAVGSPQMMSDDELGYVEGFVAQMALMQDKLVSAGVFAAPRSVAASADRQTAVLAALGR